MQKKTIVGVLLLCAGISPLPGSAQEALEHDSGAWFFLFGRARFSDRFFGQIEISPRVGSQFTQFQNLLIRPSLILQIGERLQGSLGYLYMPRWNENGPLTPEHRAWQQLQMNVNVGPVNLLPRLRFEQRFRGAQNATEVAFRLRSLLRGSLPILEFGSDSDSIKDQPPKMLSIVFFDELFVNLGDSPGWTRTGFDQNRIFTGLNLSFLPGISVEAGYMNQLLQNLFPGSFLRMSHLMVLNFTAAIER